MMKRILWMVVVALAATGAWAADFTVNAGDTSKRVFPLNGVNAGPGHMKHLPGHTFTEQYQEMGIPLVRTHDYYGPCDLSNIWPWGWGPHSVLPVDPYRFSDTDAVISEIEDAGCDVMFRLGESWDNDRDHYAIPPSFSSVAGVCKNIVERYEDRVKLWEIWNEPNHWMFWDLTEDPDCEQFIQMYIEVANRLEDEFTRIKIGGPGAKGDTTHNLADFAEYFARACKEAAAPLDFYSWHSYNRERMGPYVFALQAQEIRKSLNAAGCGKTHSILGEWSSVIFKSENQGADEEDQQWNVTLGNVDGAAFSAAALIYLHLYSDVRYACRYRGDYWIPADGNGLLNADGSPKKPGYAFKAYAGLFPQQGRRRMYLLSAEGGDTGNKGNASNCRAIMATTDTTRTVINVLISLWQHGNEGFKLTVNNLPEGWHEPMMEHYVVSEDYDYQEKRKRSIAQHYNPGAAYTYTCKQVPSTTSSVHFIRLYDATRFPTLKPTGMVPVQPPQQWQSQRKPIYPRRQPRPQRRPQPRPRP